MANKKEIPGVISGGNGDGSVFFWNIYDGALSRKSEQGEEGSVSRVNKKGDTVWEIHERGVTGTLQGLEFEDSDYGVKLKVTLIPAPGFKHVIDISKKSRYFGNFIEKLPNIKLDTPISFSPYSFESDGRNNIGVSVVQDGKKIKSWYRPVDEKGDKLPYRGGYPKLPRERWEDMTEREQTNYFYDVDEFLVAQVNKWREKYSETSSPVSVVESAASSTQPVTAKPAKSTETTKANASKPGQQAPTDDLPF